MPGWETPYGTVSRAEDYNRWRAMAAARQRAGTEIQGGPMYTAPPLAYSLPPETANRWQYPTYQQTPWDPQPRPMPAPVGGGAPPISASVPLGARTAPMGMAGTPPGTPMLPATTGAPVGPWSPGMMTPATGAYPGMRPPALGAYPAGLGTPYPAPATAPSDAYLPLRMKGPWPSGTPAAPGGQAPAGGGAAAGTPTATGAFGPFGSIEDWRNQFYQEHGRWPTDVDAQDAIASFGFLGQTGRPPTQQEWEDRWYGGYGGTTQWGPMGGQYGYGAGGGGGWAPPPEPSWWGGNVFGEEGWTYLPAGAGQYPYPTPERGEQTGAPWYNIKDIKTFQQVDPQWRDWLQQAMQSQQQHWENPLMAPIQWMQPAAQEL